MEDFSEEELLELKLELNEKLNTIQISKLNKSYKHTSSDYIDRKCSKINIELVFLRYNKLPCMGQTTYHGEFNKPCFDVDYDPFEDNDSYIVVIFSSKSSFDKSVSDKNVLISSFAL